MGNAEYMGVNKKKPREERYGEDVMEEAMLDLCVATAPKIANSMRGYKKDAEMLCRRVVKENIGDMIDAVSLGEDMNAFCRDNKICPMDMDQMMNMVEAVANLAAKKDGVDDDKDIEEL